MDEVETTTVYLNTIQLQGQLNEYLELIPAAYKIRFLVNLSDNYNSIRVIADNIKFKIKKSIPEKTKDKFYNRPLLYADIIDNAGNKVLSFNHIIPMELMKKINYGSAEFFVTFDDMVRTKTSYGLSDVAQIKNCKILRITSVLEKEKKK